MKELDVAVIGDIAWNHDITPLGNKISPGGAAYYSAVGAARFSEKVGVVAKIGRDFDTELLTRKGIDIEGVRVINGGKTCQFVIVQHGDNTREFTAQRGVAGIVETAILPDTYMSAKFIHLPTQLPEHALTWLDVLASHRHVSVDSFEKFVKEFPELTKQMFCKASLIFANEVEFEIVRQLGETVFDTPIVLKKGKDGAAYIHGKDIIMVPAPMITPIDTTGAGDVLAGAFLAQRANGVSIEISLEQAVRAASLSVTLFGVEHIAPDKSMHLFP